jgi:hypothetical protein
MALDIQDGQVISRFSIFKPPHTAETLYAIYFENG